MKIQNPLYCLSTLLLLFSGCAQMAERSAEVTSTQEKHVEISAVNEDVILVGAQTLAITGVRLIDGHGGAALEDATVIVKDDLIWKVGKTADIEIPEEAEMVEGEGLTLMPGLIDAHFHLGNQALPTHFLHNGVTSVRDPGAWIESYANVRASDDALPRLFLTGPHLDMFPPAYPKNSSMVRDVWEARTQVKKFVEQGASAIKVYFRIPPEIMEAICEEAHAHGIPVTAHLEITSATEAIQAGIDGIEHVTSFGIDQIPYREAERYRQAVLADNNARRNGRYEMWSDIDLAQPKTDSLIQLIVEEQTVVSPTLAIFEYQLEGENLDTVKRQGFEKMLAFVGKAKAAGAPLVVGSHGIVPYSDFGWAYQREMELLVDSGLSNAEVIQAATMENARFFRIEDRLGSIEAGKQADLILLRGNPYEDIKAMYEIEKVMLNGKWIPPLPEEE